jgi:isopentenyl-diphosphate delta-isomerase
LDRAAARRARKLDHLRLALAPTRGDPGWRDVWLVHQSLPEAALDAVDLRTTLLGRELAAPVVINAMTGGVQAATDINRTLGRLARELGLAVAVGSQRAALDDPSLEGTYAAVREANPDGLVLANLGAGATVAEARRAVAMIGADALQLHLNAPQELQMAEGDRDFRGQLARIAEVVAALDVPVVVKECGFGMSRETAERLYAVGVRTVDVGGRGGTNFARIERRRSGTEREADPGLVDWGIPTAASLLEVVSAALPGLEVIASGGIRWGSEAARALALGASAVGVAGPVWQALHGGGYAGARAYLERLVGDLRTTVLLAGATDLEGLRRAPRVLTGLLRDWAAQRCRGERG